MACSAQMRLLGLTARLTNNEFSGQNVSYAKQRLADQSQQICTEYNNALDATKLTILTGFNDANAVYTDIGYNVVTNPQMALNNKQYIVSDPKGRVLVTRQFAKAFESGNGDYNKFLAAMGYSQSNITVKYDGTDSKEQLAAQEQIHEAWDKYFASINKGLGDNEHDFGFSWTSFSNSVLDGYAGYAKSTDYVQKKNSDGTYAYENRLPVYETTDKVYNMQYDAEGKAVTDDEGNIVYTQSVNPDGAVNVKIGDAVMVQNASGQWVQQKDNNGDLVYHNNENGYKVVGENGNIVYDPINYEGTTTEQRKLYDAAIALTEAYLGTSESIELKNASDSTNKGMLTYYQNIFNRMQSGYFCYTTVLAEATKDPSHYIYSADMSNTPINDNAQFEAQLLNGELKLEYYSTTEKKFVSTTVSEDQSIQEVRDQRAMALAEAKYNEQMADIERKDKMFDLELKKLDTEHNALQTEYESVNGLIKTSIEKSFNVFS